MEKSSPCCAECHNIKLCNAHCGRVQYLSRGYATYTHACSTLYIVLSNSPPPLTGNINPQSSHLKKSAYVQTEVYISPSLGKQSSGTVFRCWTPNINVLDDYFLLIMSEYTLSASTQHGCWQVDIHWTSTDISQNLLYRHAKCKHGWTPKMQPALCYICLQTSQIAQTTQNNRTPGNPTYVAMTLHLYHRTTAACSRTSILRVSTVIYFCKFLANPNIDLELDCIFG